MVAEVVVAGFLCLDIIPPLVGSAQLLPGRMIEAGPAILATGGAVATTGLALHRLGVSVRLVGKIGDDLFGQAIRATIAAQGAGLADSLLVAAGQASGYSIVLSPPAADRLFVGHLGCNATFGAADVRDADLDEARLLHFGYPPLMEQLYRDDGAELVTLFRRAKAAGLTTSLDFAMPDPNGTTRKTNWRTILAATLPFVDLFLPTIEEMLLLLDPTTFDRLTSDAGHTSLIEQVTPEMVTALSQELLEMGARMVGLKVGHRGLYLRTAGASALATMGRGGPTNLDAWADRELWAPCYAVDVVGTTGAGDATIAGLLLALLRGFGPHDALATACAVGACSVEAADAISGVLNWPATAARFATGWPRLPLSIEAPGWHWDTKHTLWVGAHDGS